MNSDNPHLYHPKYRSDIDGLRAIAVLSVVGFHAFGVMGGYTGVDIFFVISGFLISTIIFENLEKDSFSFNEFYQRRIRRIFPSLLLVLITCLIIGWFVLYADEYEQLGKHVSAGSAFISNLVLWSESGYFDTVAEKKPLLHLWSLGIEEQFYFIWPIIGWILWRFRAHFFWISLFILALSFGLNAWLIGIDSIATFYSPLTRFWELLIGACLAYITLFKKEKLNWINQNPNLFGTLGFFLIIASIALLTKEFAFPGWWALLPTLGAMFVIASGPHSWVGQKILSRKALVWIGLISFPLYLWHWPLLTFARLLNENSQALKLSAIGMAFFLAWASYRFVETPIRYGKNLNTKTYCLLAIMFLVLISALVIYHSKGFQHRIDDGQDGRLAQKYRSQLEWPESFNNSAACRAVYGDAHYCMISNTNQVVTAALLGDSHANHFYPGLEAYIKKKGGNLALLGLAGCAPFMGVDWIAKPPRINPNCYSRTNHLYQKVLDDKNIKTVFLAYQHNMPFIPEYQFVDQQQSLTFENNYQAAVATLTRTIKAFESKGKKVVIIYDTPSITVDIKNCAFKRPYLPQNNICDYKQDSLIQDFSSYDKMLAAVLQNTNAEVFDTRPFMKGNFPIDASGNLNYRDSDHLSLGGSLFFADKYHFEQE